MPLEWKKPAVFGAACGIAASTILLITGGFVSWLSSRPKGMDMTAIKAVGSRALQTFTVSDEEQEMMPSGFELYFVLANTTGRDYTLSEDVKLFERDTKTGALSELKGKLDHPFLIPAKDKAEIGIGIEYSCRDLNVATGITTQRDSRACYDDAVGSLSGFLALDYSNHIRIELPKPTLAPVPGNTPVQAESLPPDKGDIFDRVAGCQRASRLVASCKAQHISVGKDDYAYYGGWAVPLPQLPVPPNSYELEPSSKVCSTASQWQNLCRAKK